MHTIQEGSLTVRDYDVVKFHGEHIQDYFNAPDQERRTGVAILVFDYEGGGPMAILSNVDARKLVVKMLRYLDCTEGGK